MFLKCTSFRPETNATLLLLIACFGSQAFSEKLRQPLDLLKNSVVGMVERPTVFNWRDTSTIYEVSMSEVSEFNNFETDRYGVRVLFPSKTGFWGIGLHRYLVTETAASQDYALTRYRQTGRPSRFALDLGKEFVVAEGIGNQYFSSLQNLQFVLSAGVGLRYHHYDYENSSSDYADVFRERLQPEIKDESARTISDGIPDGMNLSTSRYDLLLEINLRSFFKQGMFANIGFTWGMPVADSSESPLQNIWDLTIGTGFAI